MWKRVWVVMMESWFVEVRKRRWWVGVRGLVGCDGIGVVFGCG